MALFCPAPHPGSTPKVGLLVLGRAGTVWESRLAFAGLSTRRYPVGLEPVGHRVEQTGRSTSKSAVSRRFVAATETALADLLAADLSELDLVALVIGIDGGKALRAAVVRVFDHPVIARCQLHKIRNVADKLPDHLAATVTKRMRAAYRAQSAILAEAQLEALAKELQRTHPGAAGSLREGLSETLTVLRLGVSPTLARTLRSTNCIESMISIARTHSANVKNWQNGNMALRWCAAGMIEARGQFRRVNGHLHLPALRAALDAHVAAQTVGATRHHEPMIAA